MFQEDELTWEEKKGMKMSEIILEKAKKAIETREEDTKSGFFIPGENNEWEDRPRLNQEKTRRNITKKI